MPFCLFCCARLPSDSPALEAGCNLLCGNIQRRGRQRKTEQVGHTEASWSRLDISRSTRGVGQHHHVAALLQLCKGMEQVYGARALGGPVWCLNVKRVIGNSQHGVTSSR